MDKTPTPNLGSCVEVPALNGEERRIGHLEDKETNVQDRTFGGQGEVGPLRLSLGDVLEASEGIWATIYLTYPTTEFLTGRGWGGRPGRAK